jgi:TrmH family RNA methyltransferase
MLVEKITSRQNPLVKRFRRVRAGTERGFLFLEGVRLVEEALASGLHFETVAFAHTLELQGRGLELLEKLRSVPCRGANVSPQVMQALSETETPQGIAAIVGRPAFQIEDIFDAAGSLVVIADQLQDPGNLGTIVRTAEAAGASGAITTRNTVDPFNQKALRASMGSALRLPIATGVRSKEAVALCKKHALKLVMTRPASQGGRASDDKRPSEICYSEADLSKSFALVLGGEAEGASSEMLAAADEFVFIPMASAVESLNVASAAAVILYEAARQRGFRFDATGVPR